MALDSYRARGTTDDPRASFGLAVTGKQVSMRAQVPHKWVFLGIAVTVVWWTLGLWRAP